MKIFHPPQLRIFKLNNSQLPQWENKIKSKKQCLTSGASNNLFIFLKLTHLYKIYTWFHFLLMEFSVKASGASNFHKFTSASFENKQSSIFFSYYCI